jgi:cytochrome b561
MSGATAQRYTAVAIVLHWAIAFAILLMIPLGLWMHEAAEHGGASSEVFRAYQLHKSIGLTVLALSLVRLGGRLANPPPPLPEHMPAWERIVAKATHWAFYALMIGLPLTGWLFVSAGWSVHDDSPLPVPTRFFGLFTVPHLFGLQSASDEVRSAVAEAASEAHELLAYATIGLAALHAAAALKHHFFDKDATLAHMVPFLRAPFETAAPPANPARLAVLGVGLSLTAVALAAALFALTARNETPAPPASTVEIVEPAAPPPEAPAPNETEPAVAPATTEAAAPSWRVNSAASSIGFVTSINDGSGDTPIQGRFTRWRADIRFDPEHLDRSRVDVAIETASARTGVGAQEDLLPGPDWFNAGAIPTATFRSDDIRRRGDGYEARGELSIRGRTRNVTLPFTLIVDGAAALMNGRVTIDRRDFDIGKDADGDDMVARNVDVVVRVEATRAP